MMPNTLPLLTICFQLVQATIAKFGSMFQKKMVYQHITQLTKKKKKNCSTKTHTITLYIKNINNSLYACCECLQPSIHFTTFICTKCNNYICCGCVKLFKLTNNISELDKLIKFNNKNMKLFFSVRLMENLEIALKLYFLFIFFFY